MHKGSMDRYFASACITLCTVRYKPMVVASIWVGVRSIQVHMLTVWRTCIVWCVSSTQSTSNTPASCPIIRSTVSEAIDLLHTVGQHLINPKSELNPAYAWQSLVNHMHLYHLLLCSRYGNIWLSLYFFFFFLLLELMEYMSTNQEDIINRRA